MGIFMRVFRVDLVSFLFNYLFKKHTKNKSIKSYDLLCDLTSKQFGKYVEDEELRNSLVRVCRSTFRLYMFVSTTDTVSGGLKIFIEREIALSIKYLENLSYKLSEK
jgi:hypothetical protein